MRLAELQRAEGFAEDAQRTLARALRSNTKPPHASRLRLRRAQWLLADGRTDDAQRVARALKPEELKAAERSAAELLYAQLAGARGALVEQLLRLGRVQHAPEAASSPTELPRASWPLPVWLRAAVEREFANALGARPEAELETLAQRLGAQPPAVRVWLQSGVRALARGDGVRARRALENARRVARVAGDAARIAVFENLIAAAGSAPLAALPGFDALSAAQREAARISAPLTRAPVAGVLGVALPLSGDYADFGAEALQGVTLAAGLFSERGTSSALRLRIVDTRGEAQAAAAAVTALAAQPQVLAVIGGLLASETDAAATAAARAGIPLLVIGREKLDASPRTQTSHALRTQMSRTSRTARASHTQTPSPAHASRAQMSRALSHAAHTFDVRLGAAPLAEAERVAAYAFETLGLSRFAILYPDLPYGRALRAAFWDAVEARGGAVSSVARYKADATDFYTPIRRLIGYELLTRETSQVLAERERLRKRAKRLPLAQAAALRAEARALRGPEDEPLPPFVDFDALFIPDSYENVGLIASHLAFHEVRGVRLLGSSPWNAPALLTLGGPHLNGAVFSGGSFDASERASLASFARRYRARFDAKPGDLAAVAFDAANLAILALASGAQARDEVLHHLRAEREWPGVSGWISVGARGAVSRRPHLLGVDNARFISIDERGEPPHLPVPLPFCEPETEGDDEARATAVTGEPAAPQVANANASAAGEEEQECIPLPALPTPTEDGAEEVAE